MFWYSRDIEIFKFLLTRRLLNSLATQGILVSFCNLLAGLLVDFRNLIISQRPKHTTYIHAYHFLSIGYCANSWLYAVLGTQGMFHNYQGHSPRWLCSIPKVPINSHIAIAWISTNQWFRQWLQLAFFLVRVVCLYWYILIIYFVSVKGIATACS